MLSWLWQRQAVIFPNQKYPNIVRYSMFGLINRICINVINGKIIAPEDCHSHVWNYCSVVLYGSYLEGTLVNNKLNYNIFKPFNIIYRTHDEFHNIIPLSDKVITLFFRSKPKKTSASWWNKLNGFANENKYWLSKGVKKNVIRELFSKLQKY